jgi:hypothetical protein
MTNNPLEDTKTHVIPEPEMGAGLASPAPGIALDGKTRATWEEGNSDSGRPPWGLLLLGIAALSAVYWLWGREPRVISLRASTPPQRPALALALLPTIPSVSLPDGTVLSLTKNFFPLQP